MYMYISTSSSAGWRSSHQQLLSRRHCIYTSSSACAFFCRADVVVIIVVVILILLSLLTHRQAHRAASGISRQSLFSSTTSLFIVQLGNAGLLLTELDAQNVERFDHKQAFGQVDVTDSIDELPRTCQLQ
eukprot:scaffold37051_cov21-Prasinocladus_malaysianus.AAC.1